MITLMTIEDIAAHLQVSKRLARAKVVARPDFPRPVIALSQKHKRWSLADFESWLATSAAKWQR